VPEQVQICQSLFQAGGKCPLPGPPSPTPNVSVLKVNVIALHISQKRVLITEDEVNPAFTVYDFLSFHVPLKGPVA